MRKYEKLWNYIKSRNEDTITLTFEEIGEFSGFPIDHTFLQYKKELSEYGWEVGKISMKARNVLFNRRKESL